MRKLQAKLREIMATVVTLLLTSQMAFAVPSPDESKEIEKPSAQDIPPPQVPPKKTIPGPPEPNLSQNYLLYQQSLLENRRQNLLLCRYRLPRQHLHRLHPHLDYH